MGWCLDSRQELHSKAVGKVSDLSHDCQEKPRASFLLVNQRTEAEDANEEEESKGEADDEAETPEARAKRVQEKVNQGKIEVAPAKHERE